MLPAGMSYLPREGTAEYEYMKRQLKFAIDKKEKEESTKKIVSTAAILGTASYFVFKFLR